MYGPQGGRDQQLAIVHAQQAPLQQLANGQGRGTGPSATALAGTSRGIENASATASLGTPAPPVPVSSGWGLSERIPNFGFTSLGSKQASASSSGPAAAAGSAQAPSQAPSGPADAKYAEIGADVRAYVEYTLEELKARLPKAIIYSLVQAVKKGLFSEWFVDASRMGEAALRALLVEDGPAVQRRAIVASRLALLQEASDDINASV